MSYHNNRKLAQTFVLWRSLCLHRNCNETTHFPTPIGQPTQLLTFRYLASALMRHIITDKQTPGHCYYRYQLDNITLCAVHPMCIDTCPASYITCHTEYSCWPNTPCISLLTSHPKQGLFPSLSLLRAQSLYFYSASISCLVSGKLNSY